ncbi:hypothetical protein [Sphingomonas colocasiae]|uniref:Uncharacterized protein n=1 Tax=Sphingomonas colocasiae TaxID=1848973 RepID=A0ABS7PV46_9SPHN|nr:hypothetical protein [Sphingomonas colocasiae]MBY8825141.1 hypothetical protein [Sphingomonas colocasiae]
MPARRRWRAALALSAAAALAVPPADAQTVLVPAPQKPSPRPAWNCRAQQSVGATKIHASRQLDAAGASLTDNAGWTDVHTADPKAPLTVSVTWHPRPKPMNFADGMAAFYFRTAEPMAGPIRVQLGHRRAIEVPAGQSYDNPRHFSAYARIDKLLGLPGDDGALRWTLGGTAPGKPGKPVVHEGAYPAGELSALKSGFAELLARLDAMQADFANRCQRN